ncbi:hypothetical protein [Spirulina subsalsa]|nr:hypothetical protein [Spirulina subsalsa]
MTDWTGQQRWVRKSASRVSGIGCRVSGKIINLSPAPLSPAPLL